MLPNLALSGLISPRLILQSNSLHNHKFERDVMSNCQKPCDSDVWGLSQSGKLVLCLYLLTSSSVVMYFMGLFYSSGLLGTHSMSFVGNCRSSCRLGVWRIV
jgi:hypothetical protein